MMRQFSFSDLIRPRLAALRPRPGTLRQGFRGDIDLVEHQSVIGWLMHDGRLRHRFVVQAVARDGTVLAEATACIHREDLQSAGIGDGKYGFELRIHSMGNRGREITVQEAETGIEIGSATLPRSVQPSLEYQIVEAQLDRDFYLSAYPDVAAINMDPVFHYLSYGFREHRVPAPGFDARGYLAAHGLEGAGINPLVHRGLAAIRSVATAPSPATGSNTARSKAERDLEYEIVAAQLDRDFYTTVYPDLKLARVDPVRHYIEHGNREGRNPSPSFGTEFYRRQHGLEPGGMNPLVHRALNLIRHPELRDRAAPSPVAAHSSLRLAAYGLMERETGFGAEPQLYSYAPMDPDRPVVLLVIFAQEPVLTRLQRSICEDYLAVEVNLVVVLTQTTRLSPDAAGVPQGAKAVICRENAGFDFGGWHDAHQLLGPFTDVPRVIMTNDSVVPTSDGLRDIIRAHCHAEADWLFSTRNHEIRSHGQSFLMSYRPDALEDDIFDLLDRPPLATKQEVIEKMEIPLAEMVEEMGFSVGYLLDREHFAIGREDLNPTLHSARNLVENGFPLIKAEYLLDELGRMRSWVEDVFDARRLSEVQCHLASRYPGRPAPDRVGLSIPAGTPASIRRGVLLYGHNAEVGGAQTLLLSLARTLTRVFNYEVVIVLEAGGANLRQFQDVAPTFVLDGNTALLDDIVAMCRGCGIDRAIFNTVVPLRRMGAFYSAGFQTVALVHEMAESIRILDLGKPVSQALCALDHVVYPSDIVRRSVESSLNVRTANPVIRSQGHFRISRSLFPYDAPRPDQARPRRTQGEKVVLCVGTAERRKGFDRFHAVAKTYQSAHPKARVRFVWVGSPQPSCDVHEDYEAAQSGDAVECRPNLDEADLLEAYRQADVYFFASRHDAMPYAVIDALHTGLPVVGYDKTGGCDTLISRFGTLLPEEAAPEDCVAALSALLAPKHPTDRTEAGRRFVAETMDFDDYAADIMALFGDHNPKLTVAVPNYCHEGFLPTRLRSILEQDYRYFDLLLLDDKSDDGSVSVLEQYRALYAPFTTTIYNRKNSGNSYRQWQKAIAAAKGELLWIAESDDACARSFLSHMILPFQDPAVALAYAHTNFLDEEGRLFGAIQDDFNWIHPFLWNGSYTVPGPVEIDRSLARANTIINVSSVVFRRSAIPPLDHVLDYRFAGDWELYIRICATGQVAFRREAQNYFRRSSGAQTSKMAYSDRFFAEHQMIMHTIAEIAGPEAAHKTAETIRRHWQHSRPDTEEPATYLTLT